MIWRCRPPDEAGNWLVYMQRNGMRVVRVMPEDIERKCFWLERLYVSFQTGELWCKVPSFDQIDTSA